jgi:hypothetical protein
MTAAGPLAIAPIRASARHHKPGMPGPGEGVPEALLPMRGLERAFQSQLAAVARGTPSDEVAAESCVTCGSPIPRHHVLSEGPGLPPRTVARTDLSCRD